MCTVLVEMAFKSALNYISAPITPSASNKRLTSLDVTHSQLLGLFPASRKTFECQKLRSSDWTYVKRVIYLDWK